MDYKWYDSFYCVGEYISSKQIRTYKSGSITPPIWKIIMQVKKKMRCSNLWYNI